MPAGFAWALVVREVIIGAGAIYVGLRGHTKLDVRPLGKLATFMVYAAVAWFFVGVEWDWVRVAAWLVGVPGLILYYVVGFQYFGDAVAAVRQARESQVPNAN